MIVNVLLDDIAGLGAPATFGPLWIGGGIGAIALLRKLGGPEGAGFVVLALVLAWIGDILLADPISGGVENVFEVSNPRHEPQKGITRVVTSDGLEVVLPHDRLVDAAFPLIVSISAEEIVVFGERPGAVSSRNIIEGTVTAIRESDGVSDLVVAVPTPIRVRLTRSAADDLRLAKGSRVWLAMRSRSFRIVG